MRDLIYEMVIYVVGEKLIASECRGHFSPSEIARMAVQMLLPNVALNLSIRACA